MTICRSMVMPCSVFFGLRSGRVVWILLLCAAILLWPALPASAKSKGHRAPRPEPELKILELKVSPNPYTIASGLLQFSALVKLPKELDGATLLEVSSLLHRLQKIRFAF